MSFRIAVDTGGTFSDVVVADDAGDGCRSARPRRRPTASSTASRRRSATAPPSRPRRSQACSARRRCSSTARRTRPTRSSPGATARTAFLTTEGFPDTLVLREGGKLNPFDFRQPVSRALRPAAADLRDPRAGRLRGRGLVAARRGRGARRRSRRLARARRRGGRGLPAVVDRQSGARGAGRRADRRARCPACRSRCRTGSTRSSASIAAPRRPRSTPR